MAEDENEKILSYGDVLLRRRDVRLLEGPAFLNDHIIDFFFTHLSSSSSPPNSSSLYSPTSPDPALLVGPSLTFWFMHCPDPDALRSAVAPLNFPSRQLILFAVNNNDNVDEEGGSHWSLLAYDLRQNVFNHYDSMVGMNRWYARELCSILKRVLGPKATAAKLVELPSPQQTNGYDCGLYVMAIAQVLWESYHDQEGMGCFKVGTPVSDLLERKVTADGVSRLRGWTRELIYSLAKSQNPK